MSHPLAVRSKEWTLADMPSQIGRVALVTGANSGLGLETSIGLAKAGATLVMACRNPAKADAALTQIRRMAPQASIDVMALDLADLASIRLFAAAFKTRYPRLDLLCNNAGVMALPYQKTRDGFEMQIGTNHLGPFALTALLLEALAAAPAARIVTVASVAHRATKGLDLDDLQWERSPYSRSEGYARSKLANLLFTFELNRRLKANHSSILALAAHPGYSATNIGGGAAGHNWFKQMAFRIGNWLLAQPADMGALPTLYAATMPDVQGGDYFGPSGWFEFRGSPVRVYGKPSAYDAKTAQRLWTISESLTQTQFLTEHTA